MAIKIKDYGRKCQSVYCKNLAVEIHHKDKNHSNNNPNNLAYLCRSCHTKEHYDGLSDSAVNRSMDLVDELQDYRLGYRLKRGFCMLDLQGFKDE